MTSPYQSSVVGCVQDIPLDDLPPNPILYITDIPNWANYRWIVQPLYGTVTASLTYIHESDSAAAQASASGMYDTGWHQRIASGYATGDVIASADVIPKDWYTSRGLTVPRTVCGAVSSLPASIPLGLGCGGVRVTSFVYFGPADATNSNITFVTTDATGLTLTPLAPGYYIDAASGKVYRDSSAPPYPLNKQTLGNEALDDVVSRICKRGGLSAADIDVADLASIPVAGYPIARQANAADCLLPLLQAYFGYASEYDAKLHFKFYGADTTVTVDRASLIEGNDSNNGAVVSNLRNQSTEFPRRVVGSYMDPAQNYTVVDVAAERRAVDVIAIGDQSFQIPVVMAAGDAAKAVDKALKVAYATLEGTLEYSVPFADADVYLSLAAGEPLQFQGKRYVLDDLILGNGSLKLTTRYDRQSAYKSNVQAILGNAPTPPTSPYSGPTTLIPMNLPSLRPQDTYGLYLAAASADGRASWRGCTVQVSYDNQTSWQSALQIVEPSVFGVLTVAEPIGGEPLTAQMNGDLVSATDDQLAANANAFALLHSAGAEIAQFKTATETTTDGEYELTDVTRGALSTTQIAGVTGDQVVMLDAVYFLPIDLSFKGKTICFRAVGFGEVAESSAVVTIVYDPDTTTIHDGGTVTP